VNRVTDFAVRRGYVAGLCLLAFILHGASAYAAAPERPDLSARAAILVDARDGHVLYRRDPAQERPIASATKLMTALVALEELPLGREVRAVPYEAAPAESRIDLRTGERMSVADLLRALLLESANDAAETLAVRAAGSVDRFVRHMNERAREIGLRHTSFANPIGLDSPGAHSTALDLSRLARRVLRNDFLAATVGMPRARLLSGARPRILSNRNRLVREVGWVDGVKTGRTAGAGYVLVGSTSRRGARLVSVVLGAPTEAARDADTLSLLRHGLAQYRRARPVRAGATLATASVEYFGGREIRLVPVRPVSVTVRRGQRLRTVVRAPDQVTGPVRAGARVGTVTVYREGRRVRSVPVVTAASVPEAGLLRKAWSLIWSPIPVLAALGIAVWLIVRRRRRILAARRGPAPAHERAG
jgi:D-alanyl-D-alanine carboxypeptidase (penicillin-binding protein 5/6)